MPWIAAIVLVLGPPSVLIHAVLGIVLTLLGGVFLFIARGLETAAPALALSISAGLLLLSASKAGVARVWLVALWGALLLLPLWWPAMTVGSEAAGAPAGAAWRAWPLAYLASDGWDPLREAPLYESWGSRTAVPEVSWAVATAVLLGIAAALYFTIRSRQQRAGTP